MNKSENFLSDIYPKLDEDSSYDKAMLLGFFDGLFKDGFDKKLWPYDYSTYGFELSKIKIVQDFHKDKYLKDNFTFNLTHSDVDGREVLDSNVIWKRGKDNSLNLRLHSIKKTGDFNIKNFAWKFVEDHKKLIDNIGDDKSKNKFTLDAYSCAEENDVLGAYRGSLVWASRGFDFAESVKNFELSDMKDDFEVFLKKRRIFLTDAQKEKFTKPYHFACFRPDLTEKAKIIGDDNEISEKEVSLGKIFLLTDGSLWSAELSGGKESQETYNFARTYNKSLIARNALINKVNTELGVKDLRPSTQIYYMYNNLKSRMMG